MSKAEKKYYELRDEAIYNITTLSHARVLIEELKLEISFLKYKINVLEEIINEKS